MGFIGDANQTKWRLMRSSEQQIDWPHVNKARVDPKKDWDADHCKREFKGQLDKNAIHDRKCREQRGSDE